MASDDGVDESHLEIAHVLFTDIVGYSKLLTNEQRERVGELNRIVRNTEAFRTAKAADRLIMLPTGDGMVLAFFTSPDAPVRCAIEISRALGKDLSIPVRMGIHSGPVEHITDVSERPNLAGAGINMAQRVMGCGDAGHILLSARAADDLMQISEWKSKLHPLGEVELKHGVRTVVVNLQDGEIGNADIPQKIRAMRLREQKARHRKMVTGAGVSAGIAAAAVIAIWVTRPAPIPPSDKSIAVLPFENLSADPNSALFVTGVQDEVLTRAAKIAALKVISRTSTRGYEPRPANLREIAKQLGVANILEGSVQKIQNKVRVNVQLISAATDAHLWAESYDRELTDVFAVEADVASRIANSLKATLTPEEKDRVHAVPTTNPDAYEEYLQGREMGIAVRSYLPEYGAKQREHYEKAIALDPEFALAHAALSFWYSIGALGGGVTPENRTKARSEADEALRLQPDLGEAHKALGRYYYGVERDYDAAAREYAIALRALPNDSELIELMSYLEKRRNHWRAAIAGMQRAVSLDPRNLRAIRQLAGLYGAVRDYAAAEETKRREVDVASSFSVEAAVLSKVHLTFLQWVRTGNVAPMQSLYDELPKDFDPDLRGFILQNIAFAKRDPDLMMEGVKLAGDKQDLTQFFLVAQPMLVKGDLAHANEVLDGLISGAEADAKKNPSEAQFHSKLGMFYAFRGRKEEAIREGQRGVELLPESKDAAQGPVLESFLARTYARVGEADRAIDLIEHLLTIPCEGDAAMSKRELQVDWSWDPLRQNPRFQKIISSPEPKVIYN